MTHIDDCEVIIVGGGLAGLSCAMFLAWHGVETTLVERHPDLLSHPRQRSVPVRIMELYRQVGLETRVKSAGGDYSADYVAVTADTLADPQHRPVDKHVSMRPSESVSPCTSTPIDQNKVEALLRDRARELGARITFGTTMCGFTQHRDGVDARFRDLDGREYPLQARYLVAADGDNSPIRRQLGIPMETFGESVNMLSVLVEADLRPALAGRTVHMAYLRKPRPRTYLMARDLTWRNWVFGTTDDSNGEPDLDEYISLIREAVGDPGLPVTLRPQIPGTDEYILRFHLGAAVATHYRDNRVFLIGDAAHLMPPTGGFGGATGVLDAHNLAWKLAAVIAGHAGDGLLDSYNDERQPVGRFALRQAVARARTRYDALPKGIGPPDATEPIVDHDVVLMGYRYSSTAVSEFTLDPMSPKAPGLLRGEPGTRAPHLGLSEAPNGKSTIDLYGSGFVLLTGAEGHGWLTASTMLPVPVNAYRLGVDIDRPDAITRHGIGPRGALLVRPDGVVAWRSKGSVSLPIERLFSVLSAVLSVSPAHSRGVR